MGPNLPICYNLSLRQVGGDAEHKPNLPTVLTEWGCTQTTGGLLAVREETRKCVIRCLR